jgi:hypothetical protein
MVETKLSVITPGRCVRLVEAQIDSFLTSALDSVSVQPHMLAALGPRREPISSIE